MYLVYSLAHACSCYFYIGLQPFVFLTFGGAGRESSAFGAFPESPLLPSKGTSATTVGRVLNVFVVGGRLFFVVG